MNKDDFLYYILARRGKLLEEHPYTLDQNNIIETPIGYFRTATFEKNGNPYIAVFYSRQYDDLAAHEDGQILNPKNLSLIKILPLNPPDLLEKDSPSGDGQQERRWLLSQMQVGITIHKLVVEHSRALYREAMLHRHGENKWKSIFIGFSLSPAKDGEYGIRVTTKAHDPYHVVKIGQKNAPFHKAGAQVTRGHPSAPLIVNEEVIETTATGQTVTKTKKRKTFPLQEAKDLMMARFGFALDRLWQGLDPYERREPGGLSIYTSRVIHAANQSMKQLLKDRNWLGRVVDIAFAAYGIFPTILEYAAKAAVQIFSHENNIAIPDECQDLVAHHRIFFRSPTNLPRSFVPFKPEILDTYGMKWVPGQDKCRLSLGLPYDVNPDHPSSGENTAGEAQRFDHWIRTNYHAPNGGIVEYIGANGAFVDPEDSDPNNPDYKVIRFSFSNGVELFHDLSTDKLYAYYRTPGYAPDKRKLPSAADVYFQAGKVLAYDLLKPDTPPEQIGFDVFQGRVNSAIGGDYSRCLAVPETPPKEMLNKARTAPMNACLPANAKPPVPTLSVTGRCP